MALALFAFRSASAQQDQSSKTDSTPVGVGVFEGVIYPTKFDVSRPLREMEAIPETNPARRRENEDREVAPIKLRFAPEWDPTVQTTISGSSKEGAEIPGPLQSFDSVPNTSGGAPPDPNGAVGPNHVVTMVNSNFQFHTKTGTSVFGPAAINSLFSGFGGPCQTENAGDPVALYDRLADRWFLSQFTSAGPSYFFCVAISATPDPTGSYYRYAIPTGARFPDYPKAGVWPDAYYVSTREFTGSTFNGAGAYALNRAQALAGTANAQIISFLAAPSPAYNVGDGLLPADIDGMTPPPLGSPNYFVGSMDNNGPYAAPQDALTLWKFTANFANPPASSFVLTNTVPVAAYNSVLGLCAGARTCIPQAGTANRIDHLGYRQRPMFRLAYRNFGTHESLVTNQSVSGGTGPNGEVSGIRWWEMRSPNSSPFIHQEGTFAPGVTDGIHRWMASAAMDGEGNIGLGYSASSATLFPSVYYTGRRPGDPLGTMPQGEGIIHTGTGSQTGSGAGNRWGDYTSLSIDPVDDLTFWHFNEYVPTTSSAGWRARVGSFKFAVGASPAKGTGRFVVNDCFVGSALQGATVMIDGQVYGSTIANSPYDAPLAPGNHTYSISRPNYQTLTGSFTVVADQVTPINVCLQGAPVLVSGGASIIAAGPNGVLDPGESVTVALGIRNTNVCTTPGLTGTLQAIGGVTAPTPAAQNYGVVCGGDPTVFRQFTFTVDPSLPCGAPVTASLTLTDGASNYGTAVYVFSTGTVLGVVENFDAMTAPALPTGWVATRPTGTAAMWATSSAGTPAPPANSPPNSVYSPGPATVFDNRLDSPVFTYSAAQQLSFKHVFDLEQNTNVAGQAYDGAVLEISLNGGPFTDIIAAGGSFVSGGYTHTAVSTCCSNPLLPSRPCWSGASGSYITTVVTMPPSGAGQAAQLRWRVGTDSTVSRTGWRVDDVAIGSPPSCGGTAPVVNSAFSRKVHGAAGTFDMPLPLVPLTGAIGMEPRIGAVAGEHQVIVNFANPVSVSGATVTTGAGSATSSVSGNIVTINLNGVTDRQRVEITLSGVSDGSNVGSVRIPMGMLSGDTSGNGIVSGSDVSQVKAAAASGTVTGSPGGTYRSDVNANGTINTLDVGLVKAKSGSTLP